MGQAAARLAAIGEILTFIETKQAEPSDAAKALTFYRDHVAELHRLLERQIAIEVIARPPSVDRADHDTLAVAPR